MLDLASALTCAPETHRAGSLPLLWAEVFNGGTLFNLFNNLLPIIYQPDGIHSYDVTGCEYENRTLYSPNKRLAVCTQIW